MSFSESLSLVPRDWSVYALLYKSAIRGYAARSPARGPCPKVLENPEWRARLICTMDISYSSYKHGCTRFRLRHEGCARAALARLMAGLSASRL